MSKAAQANQNRNEGAIFEDLFTRTALRNGLLVLRNYQSCRFTYQGHVQVIPGQLDFTLINNGITGFFDCKSYQHDYFTFSQLDSNQVERAELYNEWGVAAGFVVWFRAVNKVVFFTGHLIARRGPRTRFQPGDGQLLGRFENFDLKGLLPFKT